MGIPGIVKNFNTSIFDHGGIPSPENRLFVSTQQDSAQKYNAKFAPVILNNPAVTNSKALNQWINFFERNFDTNPLVFNVQWDPEIFKSHQKKREAADAKAQELLNQIYKKF